MLIAAISGRALAAAARRSGYAPLVADRFGDADTAALALAHRVVPARRGRPPAAEAWLAAVDALAEGRRPLGAVWGGGLEGAPAVLAGLRRHGLLGTPPEAVARLKAPFAFADLCRDLGVPHPPVARAPHGPGPWLRKRAGGAGGVHVRAARGPVRPPDYVQRAVAGRPVAALLLGNGTRAMVLGFSAQWTAPAPRTPFRYGGAVRPAGIPAAQEAALAAVSVRVAEAAGLVGLGSADFLLREDGFDLLEINPRPGATLDVFAAAPLFALHLAACAGTLPERKPPLARAAAAAVVYAPKPLAIPPGFRWPDWTADRQRPGPVAAQAPLCTVLAEEETAAAAREAVASRQAALLAMIGEETR